MVLTSERFNSLPRCSIDAERNIFHKQFMDELDHTAQKLRSELKTLIDLYLLETGGTMSAIGRDIARDKALVSRLLNPKKNFTVASYDAVLSYLSRNWPFGLIWPAEIGRPAVDEVGG
jgi:hypothetical protein